VTPGLRRRSGGGALHHPEPLVDADAEPLLFVDEDSILTLRSRTSLLDTAIFAFVPRAQRSVQRGAAEPTTDRK
jgi:hypothetical protein